MMAAMAAADAGMSEDEMTLLTVIIISAISEECPEHQAEFEAWAAT